MYYSIVNQFSIAVLELPIIYAHLRHAHCYNNWFS